MGGRIRDNNSVEENVKETDGEEGEKEGGNGKLIV